MTDCNKSVLDYDGATPTTERYLEIHSIPHGEIQYDCGMTVVRPRYCIIILYFLQKCELCKLPGATVGCNTRDCPQNFHFACAKLAQCSFQNDKKVFCPKHTKNIDAEVSLCIYILKSEDSHQHAHRQALGFMPRYVNVQGTHCQIKKKHHK